MFLEGTSGEEVRIEPDLFFNLMVRSDRRWRVVQQRKDAITFLVLGPHAEFEEAEFLQGVGDALEKFGAKRPTLTVEIIDDLRRTKPDS